MIDVEKLKKHFAGDEEILFDLIDNFAREIPNHFLALSDAFNSSNEENFRRTAHTIKGLVSNFFDPEIVQQALKLEKNPLPNNLEEVEILRKAIDLMLLELRSLIASNQL